MYLEQLYMLHRRNTHLFPGIGLAHFFYAFDVHTCIIIYSSVLHVVTTFDVSFGILEGFNKVSVS